MDSSLYMAKFQSRQMPVAIVVTTKVRHLYSQWNENWYSCLRGRSHQLCFI